jgi:hypothetical protein
MVLSGDATMRGMSVNFRALPLVLFVLLLSVSVIIFIARPIGPVPPAPLPKIIAPIRYPFCLLGRCLDGWDRFDPRFVPVRPSRAVSAFSALE